MVVLRGRARSGFTPDDLVVEIGGGTGVLTRELASVVGRVVAVELDPFPVSRLRRRFASNAVVQIVEANALDGRLPRQSFRAFGNIPFGITTALLRKLLDDPQTALVRADLLIEVKSGAVVSVMEPLDLIPRAWQEIGSLDELAQQLRSAQGVRGGD